MLRIYGIKNCNSVKKALDFVRDKNLEFEFFDYKKKAPDEKLIANFVEIFGLEKVLNKKGTTWKKLNEKTQEKTQNLKSAIEILTKNSSMIKRPIILGENVELIGFDEVEYEEKLG